MMEPIRAVSPSVFTFFDGLALVASIASLVLSIVAIWLTFKFKQDADKVNLKTIELLVEIRTDAKSIVGGVMQEYHATGEVLRDAFRGNRVTGSVAPAERSDPAA